jgi:hypothetical protein
MEKSKLKELKKDYASLQKKYNLPDFELLNQDFYIEKAAEIETDYLAREIRRFVADKFSNYLRFIEAILNPINVPMFIFSIVKSINAEEKERLSEVYKKLAKTEVSLIELDIHFSEEKEAIFLKESYKTWQEIKKDIMDFMDVVKKNWDNKIKVNGKDYFG